MQSAIETHATPPFLASPDRRQRSVLKGGMLEDVDVSSRTTLAPPTILEADDTDGSRECYREIERLKAQLDEGLCRWNEDMRRLQQAQDRELLSSMSTMQNYYYNYYNYYNYYY